jgi:hypothetical protein
MKQDFADAAELARKYLSASAERPDEKLIRSKL